MYSVELILLKVIRMGIFEREQRSYLHFFRMLQILFGF